MSWQYTKPKEIAQKYNFQGGALNRYSGFVSQAVKEQGKKIDTLGLLLKEDEDLLLELFKYHINNVGNPDGLCRYGLQSRTQELELINDILAQFNMQPYGNEGSFGYFTLGHKESLVFSLKAAKTSFKNVRLDCLSMGALEAGVESVTDLLDCEQFAIVQDNAMTEPKQEYAFLVLTGEAIHKLKETVDYVKQIYKGVHVHLMVEHLGILKDIFDEQDPCGILNDFYVDTISVSDTTTSSSLSKGIMLTRYDVQQHFNKNKVSYIGAEDSTVGGSRNGTYLLLEYYCYHRFGIHMHEELRDLEGEALNEALHQRQLPMKYKRTLQEYVEKMAQIKDYSIGYPINQLWNDQQLMELFRLLIKEYIGQYIGYSTVSGSGRLTQITEPKTGASMVGQMENEISRFYREMFFDRESLEDYSGYVTTGGTEGNYIGMFMAKKRFGDNGVLFLTSESHYSISKGATIFGLKAEEVACDNRTGEMIYASLKEKITEQLAFNKELCVVLNINLGSTMRGAIDYLSKAKEIIDECNIPSSRLYVHCDAALFGHFLPYIKASKEILPFKRSIEDSKYIAIDSIAVSGHKFLGAPVPCGFGLFRSKGGDIKKDMSRYFEENGSITTGATNDYLVAMIWKRVKELGHSGLYDFANNCMYVSQYAYNKMDTLSHLTGVNVRRNKNSNILILNPCPARWILDKWGLPIEEGISHVDIMPHMSINNIDALINDMIESVSNDEEGIIVRG